MLLVVSSTSSYILNWLFKIGKLNRNLTSTSRKCYLFREYTHNSIVQSENAQYGFWERGLSYVWYRKRFALLQLHEAVFVLLSLYRIIIPSDGILSSDIMIRSSDWHSRNLRIALAPPRPSIGLTYSPTDYRSLWHKCFHFTAFCLQFIGSIMQLHSRDRWFLASVKILIVLGV